MTGRVLLVGAGPGDPDLLTVRGRRYLGIADVVVHDHLVDRRFLDAVRSDATLISIGAPHGESERLSQSAVTQLLIDHARRGALVLRLKNGDPTLFGRAGEEAAALVAAGIPFEIVPGVTSALAVPAYAGIPVTHRDHASLVTIVTGHRASAELPMSLPWPQLASVGGTLVFLMALRTLDGVVERLLAHGLPGSTPAAVVQHGTMAEQRTIVATVATLVDAVRAAGLRSPAVLVVGTVVQLRDTLAWVEQRPLFGRRVLVTRPRGQADALVDRLTGEGAEVVTLPTIEIAPPAEPARFDDALARLAQYDWVIFTSVNGVAALCDGLLARGGDIRSLARARLAAIGSETAAALRARLLQPAVVPADYRAEGLLEALAAEDLNGLRILLPRAAGARAVLPEQLTARGASVDEVIAYQAVLPAAAEGARLRALVANDALAVVTFTSSSTVRNFVTLVGEDLLATMRQRERPVVACIGPVTAATAREYGLRVAVQPERYTAAALADAVVEYFCAPPGDPLSEKTV